MKSIKQFYNHEGWKNISNRTTDANLFEDLRPVAKKYVSKCRLRVLNEIPQKGGKNFLDFASGPIQYKEYLKYSKKYKYRHCVDFSEDAIKIAKKKLKKHGKYYCDDFNKIRFKKDFFDCIISIHTIYHIKESVQKKTIEKLIKIVKKNSKIIIVYSNPNTFINKFKNFINYKKKKQKIYFYCHPNSWWYQFRNSVEVEIKPWRSFSSQHQKMLFPNNFLGKKMLDFLYFLEEKFPNFFSTNFQYTMKILTKK